MAASAGPTRASVAVAVHGVAQRAGVAGVVVSLARADGQAAGARVRLSVDYSKFGNNFGGGFGSRLHPVAMPSCVLSTPDVPACRVQTPIPGFANDENARVVSVDVDVAGGPAAGGGGAGPAAGGGATAATRRKRERGGGGKRGGLRGCR